MYSLNRFVVTGVVVLLFVSPVLTQTLVPVGPFTSVELRNGGVAILRHGPTPRVTLVNGSLNHSDVTIVNGGRLLIDKCKTRCPKNYELVVEIVSPVINSVVVAHGGKIQSQGNFPRQPEIRLVVSNGGTIDIRLMAVDKVNASVEEGGKIFTMPQTTMLASVSNGGNIIYWGNADVKSSIQKGGVVTKGTAAEANAPLSELSPALTALPPVPALVPIPAVPKP